MTETTNPAVVPNLPLSPQRNMEEEIAWAICPHIKLWADADITIMPECQRCPNVVHTSEGDGQQMCRANANKAARAVLNLLPASPVAWEVPKAVDVVNDLIASNPDKLAQMKDKPATLGWFVGQAMKRLNGEGDPRALAVAFQVASPTPVSPQGWQLAPVEPTEESDVVAIVGHLGAALVQSCASDDKIIIEHIQQAHSHALALMRKSR